MKPPGIINTEARLTPIGELERHPDNPRRGVTPAIIESIRTTGFYGALIAQTSTNRIRAATNGQAPCVILDKPLTDRMASTVRHNRARGRHQLTGMASMIYAMLDAGMPDHDICNELGMEPEELHRLKHVTGFSKLMQDRAYNQEWLTKNQIKARKAYRDAIAEEGER